MGLPENIIYEAEQLCKKFINKVETGRARSRETYRECKNLLYKINYWKQEENKIKKNI